MYVFQFVLSTQRAVSWMELPSVYYFIRCVYELKILKMA